VTAAWLTPLLDRLSARGAELLPPQVKQLPTGIDERLADLWRATNGMRDPVPPPLAAFLLSPDQAITTTANWKATGWLPEGMPDFIAIAGDYSGNHAIVFGRGDIFGMVGVLDHDEVLPVPTFAGLRSFLAALARSAAISLPELAEMEPELPRRTRPAARVAEAEGTLFTARRNRFVHKRAALDAFVAMQFLPTDSPAQLRPFLDSEDPWVQERACKIIGELRLEAGIPWLEELAQDGEHQNLPITCISALRRWQAPAARAALERLRPLLDEKYKAYFG
jgi:HEAT repeats